MRSRWKADKHCPTNHMSGTKKTSVDRQGGEEESAVIQPGCLKTLPKLGRRTDGQYIERSKRKVRWPHPGRVPRWDDGHIISAFGVSSLN